MEYERKERLKKLRAWKKAKGLLQRAAVIEEAMDGDAKELEEILGSSLTAAPLARAAFACSSCFGNFAKSAKICGRHFGWCKAAAG